MGKINEYPLSTEIKDDDYVLIDGDTDKTRRFKASDLDNRNKIDKIENPVDGALPVLDNAGNLVPSSLLATLVSIKGNAVAVNVPAIGWGKAEGDQFYTNDIAVEGVTDDNLIFMYELDYPATSSEQDDAISAAQLKTGGQYTGHIILRCWGVKPEIDIPIGFIVGGDDLNAGD